LKRSHHLHGRVINVLSCCDAEDINEIWTAVGGDYRKPLNAPGVHVYTREGIVAVVW